MKKIIIAGAAAIVALAVVAVAIAATGGGNGGDDTAAVAPTATPGVETPPSATPAGGGSTGSSGGGSGAIGNPVDPSATPGVSGPLPTAPGRDTPVQDEPTVGPGTPIPSEPIIPVTPMPPLPSLPPNTYAEAAPIDGLSDVRILESFPPQYAVTIQAGLPSGCAKQFRSDYVINGNVVEITVLNAIQRADFCTAIYGLYEVNVNMGSDFQPGQTYTVRVNNQAETAFTAQ